MHSALKEMAVNSVKHAIEEDTAGNYSRALPLYMNALEKFSLYLKYQRNPKIKKIITSKLVEYLKRAEEIKAVLQEERRRSDLSCNKKESMGNQKVDRLASAIDSTIVREKPNVKWSDVVGLEGVKRTLQEAVVLPVEFPQFFTGRRRPWSAFLLYGPPGTGKSYLAKAVATQANSTFFSVSSSDLISKWMGESEKLVSKLFQMARANSPSIIFIDEIDSLCSQRGNCNESEASHRVKTEFLVQMQGVGKNENRVLILAATNTPYTLDQAIRRRFDKRIYIPLPDLDARQHMFELYLGDSAHNLTTKDFESIAQKTQGFSGSDISVCVNEVLFEPIRKAKDAKFFKRDSNKMWTPCEHDALGALPITLCQLDSRGLASKVLAPPVTKLDFNKVLSRHKPTVSKSDIEVHERFTAEFGETASIRFNPENLEFSDFSFQEINDRQKCVVRKQVVHEDLPLCMNNPAGIICGVECVKDAEVEHALGKPTMEDGSMTFEKYYGERVGEGDCDEQVPLTSEEGICYRNRRLIVNSGIAICILISSIPLLLHWIFGRGFLPLQFRLIFWSKYL